MKSIATFSLSLVLMLKFSQLSAQLIVNVILPSYSNSININNLLEYSNDIRLSITNPTPEDLSFRIIGRLHLDGQSLVRVDFETSPTEVAPAGQNRIIALSELDILGDAFDISRQVRSQNAIWAYLHASHFRWCFSFVSASEPDRELAAEQCKSRLVNAYSAPLALEPLDKSVLSTAQALSFHWDPVAPSLNGAVHYQVQVFKVSPMQEPSQAFQSNQVLWERRTLSNQIDWPNGVPMTPGCYIWTVRAFNQNGELVGTREEGQPEFLSFSLSKQL